MNTKYFHQSIDIVIDTESDLYKRICLIAKQYSKSIDSIVDIASSSGLYHLMARNLDVYAKGNAKHGKNEI